MPVPKQRHSKSRKRIKHARYKVKVPAMSTCPQCQVLKRPHRACDACGYYKDEQVIVIKQKETKKKD